MQLFTALLIFYILLHIVLGKLLKLSSPLISSREITLICIVDFYLQLGAQSSDLLVSQGRIQSHINLLSHLSRFTQHLFIPQLEVYEFLAKMGFVGDHFVVRFLESSFDLVFYRDYLI